MKIAYICQHTQTDILFPLASSTRLSCEWRIGVIQALVQLGHDVEVCGALEVTQKQILQAMRTDISMARKLLSDVDNYKFYDKVKFNENSYPSADVLLVEGGATNSFHTRKFNGDSITVQKYTFEAVCRHKGRVFWFCPEPKYSFRFGDLALPTGNAKPETDLRRLLYSSKKFLQDKTFIWMMTDHNKEEFRKRSTIPNDFPLESIVFTPYSLGEPEICAPVMPLKKVQDLEWDVVYIGHLASEEEKKRREQLTRILSGADRYGIRAAIFGNNEEGFPIPGVKFFPKTANMGAARDILNKSLLTPLVIRGDFVQTQHESNRQVQAAQCGCAPIWPKEVGWMYGNNQVDNIKDIAGIVSAYALTPAYRTGEVNKYRASARRYIDWLPGVLEMRGAAIADQWHKDLAPFVVKEDSPTLL